MRYRTLHPVDTMSHPAGTLFPVLDSDLAAKAIREMTCNDPEVVQKVDEALKHAFRGVGDNILSQYPRPVGSDLVCLFTVLQKLPDDEQGAGGVWFDKAPGEDKGLRLLMEHGAIHRGLKQANPREFILFVLSEEGSQIVGVEYQPTSLVDVREFKTDHLRMHAEACVESVGAV